MKNLDRMKRPNDKHIGLSKRENELNKQQNAKTSDKAQSRGNTKNNKETNEQRQTENINDNENNHNNKVSKIADTLTVAMNTIKMLEKSRKPSSKIWVKDFGQTFKGSLGSFDKKIIIFFPRRKISRLES